MLCFNLLSYLCYEKIILFSREETNGKPKINKLKYSAEATWPKKTNGYSTGCLPIHVRIKKVATSVQKAACDNGRKDLDSFFEVFSSGIKNSTKMAATSAITPPSFFGMDRRMAYANKKYHSGWIWGGVTSGLAGIKFSGSFSAPGKSKARLNKAAMRRIKPTVSFVV